MPLPNRTEAVQLLHEWVETEGLRRHMLAVEAAMRVYARHYGEDEDLWGLTGLLHDLDYDRFPDMDDQENGHPPHGAAPVPGEGLSPGIHPRHRGPRYLSRRAARVESG